MDGEYSEYIPVQCCLEGAAGVTTDQATSESRQKRRDMAYVPGGFKTRIGRR
jgi:hypothetical protein